MKSAHLIGAAGLAILLAGPAFAQTAAPAVPPAAATPDASAPAMDKKAIAKACSAEADKQSLHGKARKAFRSKCKKEKMS